MRKVLERQPPSGPEEVQGLKNLYDGEIAFIDEALGRLFEGLKTLGLYDNSVIIVTADHGEGFYEHEDWQHANLLYDEVLHVPLVVKWPNRARTGEVESLVNLLDIFPTILEAVNIDLPVERTDGLAAVHGNTSRRTSTLGEISWEPNETRGALMKIALRTETRKYIATFAGKEGDTDFVSEIIREELYDLAEDPEEKTNLLPADLEEVEGFRQEVKSYVEEIRVLRASSYGEKIQLDQDLIDELKALGYVNQ
jgi:arylsulfatase A-like enzyme